MIFSDKTILKMYIFVKFFFVTHTQTVIEHIYANEIITNILRAENIRQIRFLLKCKFTNCLSEVLDIVMYQIPVTYRSIPDTLTISPLPLRRRGATLMMVLHLSQWGWGGGSVANAFSFPMKPLQPTMFWVYSNPKVNLENSDSYII